MDEILESFQQKSYDECEYCLLGNMTKAPFIENYEWSNDMLRLVHTSVCGPFR